MKTYRITDVTVYEYRAETATDALHHHLDGPEDCNVVEVSDRTITDLTPTLPAAMPWGSAWSPLGTR